MARRQHLSLVVILAVVAFFSVSYLFSGSSSDATQPAPPVAAVKGDSVSTSGDISDLGRISNSILAGESIAPKLENATAKAELGRASWKLFHTMMARFPEKPTPDDSLALKTYIQLFARLYPCGDCAAHFRKLLAKYPPQVSSRQAAAGWACFVHNEVNTRLKKEQFDCNKIGDFYDCGCGDEDKKKADGEKKPSLELEKDGLTKGG
ncbi:FAD-linked sulfhydryl oxidase ERV2 [Colletotrichum trifolii]|uniref:Sulfhydryl oxidase n=1 Tax=Colletotrichum trifolii TaxID=5466 RepID=A0A4R8RQN0_COLTR|nr:FAD-linked sulfhydryl oxidase ERV2 [Colletotrichum trifolii]